MKKGTKGPSQTATPRTNSPRVNTFGTIEQLPSGRFRVRWYDPDGRRLSAPQTFLTRNDSRLFLATLETDRLRQTYKAPRRSKDTVGDYGREWIRTRAGLKQSTRYGYELDFRLYVVPYIGDRLVDQLQPAQVREWHATLGEELLARLSRTGRDGKATVARSYRLLRSILQTAVDDDLLSRNPCRLPGAGITRSTERPVLSASEIATFAAEVPGPYRAFVVLAGFSGLRAGELAALRLSD
jgi:integrase